MTSCLALDDIGLLLVYGDGPLVLKVLSFSVLNGPRGLRGPRVRFLQHASNGLGVSASRVSFPVVLYSCVV